MQAQMQRLLTYNRWAWDRVFSSVAQLDDVAYKAERPFFWGSIHGVLVHALFAEFVWISRSQGISPNKRFAPDDFVDFPALRARWNEVDAKTQAFIQTCDITSMVAYKNTDGDPHTLPQLDILTQTINHSTEHRSQLTPVLFQLGYPTEPLDYIYWASM